MAESSEQVGLAEVMPEAKEEERLIIPFNLGLDNLDLIVKACHQLNADREEVGGDRIAGSSGIAVKTTLPNLRFLVSIGVLSFNKSNRTYSLTQDGKEYASHLRSNEIKEAGNALKKLLPSTPLKEILDYVEVRKGSPDFSYESLFAKVKTLARIKEDENGEISGPYKSGTRYLIGLFDRAKLIPDGIYQQADVSRGVQISRKQPKQPRERQTSGQKDEREDTGGSVNVRRGERNEPFNVSITIEAKDSESIKQVRLLLKELRGQETTE